MFGRSSVFLQMKVSKRRREGHKIPCRMQRHCVRRAQTRKKERVLLYTFSFLLLQGGKISFYFFWLCATLKPVVNFWNSVGVHGSSAYSNQHHAWDCWRCWTKSVIFKSCESFEPTGRDNVRKSRHHLHCQHHPDVKHGVDGGVINNSVNIRNRFERYGDNTGLEWPIEGTFSRVWSWDKCFRW